MKQFARHFTAGFLLGAMGFFALATTQATAQASPAAVGASATLTH